ATRRADAVVAGPDDQGRAARDRAADVLLAWSLGDVGAEGAQRPDDAGPERDVAASRPRRLPRDGPGDGPRSRATDLAGRAEEQEVVAEREPRARADGAVHARPRRLHRGGRPAGGPRAHRMADRPGHRPRRTGRAAA